MLILYNRPAIRIGKTLFEDKWHGAIGNKITVPDLPVIEQTADLVEWDKLALVNRWVNKQINYQPDRPRDNWQSPQKTVELKTGDCEDIAILKYAILRQLGIPIDRMWLVIGKNLVSRRDHALLVVEYGDKYFALDNTTDRMIETKTDVDFNPVVSINETGRWVHGNKK